MVRAVFRGVLLGLLGLALPLGCGNTSEQSGRVGAPDVGSSTDQSRVPPVLEKSGISRYFLVNDAVKGLTLVRFEDPEASRVRLLGDPNGSYRSGLARWSANGRRLAYCLTATQVGVEPPNRLMLADEAGDFEPRLVQHPNLLDFGYQLAWIGDRAVVAVTGSFSDVPDAQGFQARYSWIDADSGAVTDLGGLPPSVAGDPSGSDRDPASVTLRATSAGVLYVDRDCNLTYLERPGNAQPLLNDCTAQAEWSGDGSFALVTSATGRSLYELVAGKLRRSTDISAALAPFATARFAWAPHAPRFVLYEGGGSTDSSITRLVYGEAKTGQIVSFDDLPRANYAGLLTDDLLVVSDWSGEQYVLDVSRLKPGAQTELLPLGLADRPGATLVASNDSSRLYYPQDPFMELELTDGVPGAHNTLFDEASPVDYLQFRLLQTDEAGLLTVVGPRLGKDAAEYAPTHQYLLSLGSRRAVIPLGSFDQAVGTDAPGIETFQSAPQYGGVFYLGPTPHGHYVDWLGFDDISHKVRLIEFQSSFVGLDFPTTVLPATSDASVE